AHGEQVVGEFADDVHPVIANAGNVDARLFEMDAEFGGVAGVGNELGGVQERLGRNAADMQTGAAGLLAGVDESDLHALIGGVEGGGVAAGTAADDDEFGFVDFGHGSTFGRWSNRGSRNRAVLRTAANR